MSYFTALVSYAYPNVVNVRREFVTVRAETESGARALIAAWVAARGARPEAGPVRAGF